MPVADASISTSVALFSENLNTASLPVGDAPQLSRLPSTSLRIIDVLPRKVCGAAMFTSWAYALSSLGFPNAFRSVVADVDAGGPSNNATTDWEGAMSALTRTRVEIDGVKLYTASGAVFDAPHIRVVFE